MDLSRLVETVNHPETVVKVNTTNTNQFDIAKEVKVVFSEVQFGDDTKVLKNLQDLTEYLYFKEGQYPEPESIRKYVYSVNRMLGCDYDLLDYVNYMGRFFITLGPVMYYELLNRLVPKMQKGYYWRRSFITPDLAKGDKDPISRLAQFVQISSREANHCYQVLLTYFGKDAVYSMLGLELETVESKPKKKRKGKS